MMKKRFYVFLVFALLLSLCGCNKNSDRKSVGYFQVCTLDYSSQTLDSEVITKPTYEYYYDNENHLLFTKMIEGNKVFVQENQIKGVLVNKAIKNAAYQGNVVEKHIDVIENDKVLKSTTYDADNKIKYNYEAIYDENWNLIEEKAVSSDNSISYWHKYEYEDGKRVRMIELDKNGGIRRKSDIIDTSIEEEYDEQNRVVKSISYLDGEIKTVHYFKYDVKDGVEITEITVMAKEEIMSHMLNTTETEKDANGKTVSRKVVNTDLLENSSTLSVEYYDELERLTRWEYFTNGELSSVISYSYETIYE